METTLLILAIVASVVAIVLGVGYFLLKNQTKMFEFADELKKRKGPTENKKEGWRLLKSVDCVLLIFANLLTILLVRYILSQFLEPFWFLTLVISVVTIPILTIAGIVEIPIAHAGVPLIFGKRMKVLLLDEGLSWILPSPIMGFEPISLQEQTIQIPKDEEEATKPLIIPAIRGLKDNANGTEQEIKKLEDDDFKIIRFVQMNARIVIRYSIVNPFKFLNQGEGVVVRGLGDLAIKTLRQMGTIMSDIDLIRQKDLFEGKIIEAMKEEQTDAGGESPIVRWGVRVHNVFIPRIAHNDPGMAKAYEAAMREEQQKTAETIEQEFLVESIERLTGKKITESGLTAQQALYAIQSERGKLTRREVIITSTGGGVAGDIVKAVATYAELLGDQPKTEKTETENKQMGGN